MFFWKPTYLLIKMLSMATPGDTALKDGNYVKGQGDGEM